MKVLHLNSSDSLGGAAIAGYRLHQGLLAKGLDSRLLVGVSQLGDDDTAVIPRHKWLEMLIAKLTWRFGFNDFHCTSSFAIPDHYFYKEADILNFHNLHGSYLNYLAIPRLTENKPAVYTLHDMWSFTGHCIYSYDCDRWQTGCGKCPYPDTYPGIKTDNTNWEWKLKHKVYSRSKLVIVTLSRWLTEQAQKSMLNCFPIHHIPNGIDTQIYQPLDPDLCKFVLGIPTGKKVLMFGAQSLADHRKGGDLLLQALQQLPDSLKAETVLLTVGGDNIKSSEVFGMDILNLGYLSSDRLKVIAYSAADLFVFPTRADNLPLVLQESMACGTPMVSFDIGGVPDLVRPKITGYLAKPEDAKDLADGIVQILDDQNLQEFMSQQCRAIALKEYSLELQAQQYVDLYRQTLAVNS
ncbi:glycosyl transferase [Nostoc sp. T09]|uniref:glycosyltransferase family 4 protein n=1 Tax=Nostoc sp. T09 TaxID=1932621 RepID=UPI000A396BBA|nr:glycosyltransferase family 4 protein [Nostoc sp. T09]OUL29874.1 glycosyl transferase [Nostoc sp. T09]